MGGIKTMMIMVTADRDVSIVAQSPSHDRESARIVIGYDLILWFAPEIAEGLKKAIDDAVAMMPSAVQS